MEQVINWIIFYITKGQGRGKMFLIDFMTYELFT